MSAGTLAITSGEHTETHTRARAREQLEFVLPKFAEFSDPVASVLLANDYRRWTLGGVSDRPPFSP